MAQPTLASRKSRRGSVGCFLLLLLIALAACTAGQVQPSAVPSPASPSQASATPSPVATTPPTSVPTQPVAPTVTTQPAQPTAPSASPITANSFKGLRLPDGDPCKLVAQADVEKALGKPIKSATVMNDPNSGAKGCFYLNDPGKGVSLSYWQSDDAKMQVLGNIAQLQKGCSFSMTATTRRVTPTPLPPAVDTLKPKPLLELFALQSQLWKEKCHNGSKDVADLGEGAFMDGNFRTVYIVAGEAYVTVLIADSDLTEQKVIEGVKLIAASLFK